MWRFKFLENKNRSRDVKAVFTGADALFRRSGAMRTSQAAASRVPFFYPCDALMLIAQCVLQRVIRGVAVSPVMRGAAHWAGLRTRIYNRGGRCGGELDVLSVR